MNRAGAIAACALALAAGTVSAQPVISGAPSEGDPPAPEDASGEAFVSGDASSPDGAGDSGGAVDSSESSTTEGSIAPSTDDPDVGGDIGALESLLDEQVVTTASRTAERASAAPALVMTIGGDELRRHGARTLDEALTFLGLGVFAQDTGADLFTELDVGASGVVLHNNARHLLLLVDGHVMNSQTTGDAPFGIRLGIPLETIDHIEVMLGPGSVVYGSNAMLGVVQVVTRRPQGSGTFAVSELSVAPPSGVDGRIVLPGGERRFGFRQRLALTTTGMLGPRDAPTGRYSLSADFQSEQTATYELPYQEDDAYYEIGPGERFGGIFSHTMRSPSVYGVLERGRWRVAAQGTTYYRSVPWVGIQRQPGTGNRQHAIRLDVSNETDIGSRTTLRSRFYGDYVRLDQRSSWMHDYWCLPGQIHGCDYRHANAARSAGVEEQLSVDFGLDGRNVMLVGMDLRMRNAVGRPADYHDRDTGDVGATVRLPYYDRTSLLAAVFAQHTARIGDAFSVNVGARFDADSLFGVRLSPRASIAYDFTDRTTLRLGYSEAFRAPSADDLFATDPTYIVAPSSLAAEVARSADLELKQRFDRGDISLRGFGAVYTGLLNSRTVSMAEYDAAVASGQLSANTDPAYVLVIDNVDKVVSLGGTATARLRPVRGLELATNLTLGTTHVNPHFGGFGDGWGDAASLPVLPTLYGNARMSYAFAEGPTLAFAAAFSSKRPVYGAVEYLPAGTSLDARPQADFRAMISGNVGDRGFGYRVGGSFSLSPLAPYLSGFGPTAAHPNDSFALTPLGRGYLFVALEYRQHAN